MRVFRTKAQAKRHAASLGANALVTMIGKYRSGAGGKDVCTFHVLPSTTSLCSAIASECLTNSVQPWHECMSTGDGTFMRLALDIDGWWPDVRPQAEMDEIICDVISIVDGCIQSRSDDPNLDKVIADNSRKTSWKKHTIKRGDDTYESVDGFVMSVRIIYTNIIFEGWAQCKSFITRDVIPLLRANQLGFETYGRYRNAYRRIFNPYVDARIYRKDGFLRLPLTNKYPGESRMRFVEFVGGAMCDIMHYDVNDMLSKSIVSHTPQSAHTTVITVDDTLPIVKPTVREPLSEHRKCRVTQELREKISPLIPDGLTIARVLAHRALRFVIVNEIHPCAICKRSHSRANKISFEVNILTNETRQRCVVCPDQSVVLHACKSDSKRDDVVRRIHSLLPGTDVTQIESDVYKAGELTVCIGNQGMTIWKMADGAATWSFLGTMNPDFVSSASMAEQIPISIITNEFSSKQPSCKEEVHAMNYDKSTRLYGLHAHVGSGKTGAICQEISRLYTGETPPTRCLIGSARVTHGASIAMKLRSTASDIGVRVMHYAETTTWDPASADIVICSYESMYRKLHLAVGGSVYFSHIFIDECECMLDNIIAGLTSNARNNKAYLEKAMRMSTRVYILDAFMYQRSYEVYKSLIGCDADEIVIERNTNADHIKRDWVFHKSKDSLLRRIYEVMSSGTPVFIGVGCKEDGVCILEDMKRLGLDDLAGEFYYQHSDNRDHFKEDLNVRWIKLQWVMTTSTCEVGVDFNPKKDGVPIKHFKHVFILATNAQLSVRTYAQMSFRVRNASQVDIYISHAYVHRPEPTVSDIESNIQRYSDAMREYESIWFEHCKRDAIMDKEKLVVTYDLLIRDWYYTLVCWSLHESQSDSARRMQRMIAFVVYMGGTVSFTDVGNSKVDKLERVARLAVKRERIHALESVYDGVSYYDLYTAWVKSLSGDVTTDTRHIRTLLEMKLRFPRLPISLKIAKRVSRYSHGIRNLCKLLYTDGGTDAIIHGMREKIDAGSEVVTLGEGREMSKIHGLYSVIELSSDHFGGIDAVDFEIDSKMERELITAVSKCSAIRFKRDCDRRPVQLETIDDACRCYSMLLEKTICKRFVMNKTTGHYSCEYVRFTDGKKAMTPDEFLVDSMYAYRMRDENQQKKRFTVSDFVLQYTHKRVITPIELDIKENPIQTAKRATIYTSSNVMALEVKSVDVDGKSAKKGKAGSKKKRPLQYGQSTLRSDGTVKHHKTAKLDKAIIDALNS
jgi:hypothetical protein